MSHLRRYFHGNTTCFTTHVTINRAPLLVEHADLLIAALLKAEQE